MAKEKLKTYCYVMILEHYHFPPNDSDMVAATPQFVVSDAPESCEYACVQAYRAAIQHATRHSVGSWKTEVKEYKSESGNDRYRVWVDSESPHCDKLVWVVRRVEFRK